MVAGRLGIPFAFSLDCFVEFSQRNTKSREEKIGKARFEVRRKIEDIIIIHEVRLLARWPRCKDFFRNDEKNGDVAKVGRWWSREARVRFRLTPPSSDIVTMG